MLDRPYLAAGLLLVGAGATVSAAAAVHFSFFYLPFTWSREPARLVEALAVQAGDRAADIGAGDGSHAVAVATIVGGGGEVLATDLDAGRRRAIVARAARAHADNVRVIDGAPDRTNLSDRCCDAIYMRTMFHHVTDPAAFARDVVRSVKPGGRIAVIDFAPGRLWFHGRDHGVTPETIRSAFTAAGCTLRLRDDHWGGATFLLVFECAQVEGSRPRRALPRTGVDTELGRQKTGFHRALNCVEPGPVPVPSDPHTRLSAETNRQSMASP